MASIYELFKTDATLEAQGVWIDYGEYGKFLLARAGGANSRYTKVLEHKTQPYRHNLKSIGNDILERILKETFIETLLLDWEIRDEKNKKIPFNQQNAMKIFDEMDDLYLDLREQANNLAIYRVKQLEDDAKN
jgi:Zn-finger nucleic acid-binding protein